MGDGWTSAQDDARPRGLVRIKVSLTRARLSCVAASILYEAAISVDDADALKVATESIFCSAVRDCHLIDFGPKMQQCAECT